MDSKSSQRPVDRDFEQFNKVASQKSDTFLLYVGIPLMLFGLLCFVWALPFPYIAFLGRYNGYLNWASFLIAILIYYHLRLSPIVSYIILFMFFGFSYCVIQLEQWQKAGGISLWLVGLTVLTIGVAMQLIVFSRVKAVNMAQLFLKGPTWLSVTILKAVKIKY
jgi:hypothetical protein